MTRLSWVVVAPVLDMPALLLDYHRPGVYGLTSPLHGGLIAYVGQSSAVSRRYLEHLTSNRLGLREYRLLPGLVILEWCANAQGAWERESYWIQMAREHGEGWLNAPYRDPPKVEPLDPTLHKELYGVFSYGSGVTQLSNLRTTKEFQEILTRWKRHLAEIRRKDKERGRRDEEAFELRVRQEVERRLADNERRILEAKVRVRQRNVAFLGLGKVETVGLNRPALYNHHGA